MHWGLDILLLGSLLEADPQQAQKQVLSPWFSDQAYDSLLCWQPFSTFRCVLPASTRTRWRVLPGSARRATFSLRRRRWCCVAPGLLSASSGPRYGITKCSSSYTVPRPQDAFKYLLSNFSKPQSLQDPPSGDGWQVLLSQLWAVVLRDLDAALLSKYVRDGKGHRFGYRNLQFKRDGRAFSGQCFLSECTNGIHKQNRTNIPGPSRNQIWILSKEV